jgi:hypothetical protein
MQLTYSGFEPGLGALERMVMALAIPLKDCLFTGAP